MSDQLSFDLSGTAPETQPLQLTLDRTVVKPGKVCPVCNRYKPYSDFSREKTTKDKYSWECRECNRSSPTTKRLNKRNSRNIVSRYRSDQNFRDRMVLNMHNNRARKTGVPGVITTEEWQALKADYNYRCAYCGYKAPILSPDHFWPMAWYKRGFSKATNEISNIVPSCLFCNHAKQDSSPFEFLAWKNGLLQAA